MTPRPESSLSGARRARELARLADPVDRHPIDVLVVGLGVTGAGVALDAASRGLRVAAVDAHDLAFGTSRWSSKLVHGGLRYLASGQVGIAHESAVERGILMSRTAVHLVRPLPFVLPLTPVVSARHAAVAQAGYLAGDLLRLAAHTSRQELPRPRRLSAVETLHRAPALDPRGLRGGLLSWDGQLVDDARLVVAIARTAAAHGARVLTRCRAIRIHGDGAVLRDELTGQDFTVRARAVVNATGVWAGELVDGVRLRPSRGTHLILPAATLGRSGDVGLHLPVLGEPGRYVITLPQDDGRVIVGLTDIPVDGPITDVPTPTEAEIDYLLDVLNSATIGRVTRSDVLGSFAGLRPLLAGPEGRTTDLSRRHAVLTSVDGVVTVVGGKLTTYRRMAEDTVDAVVRRLGAAAIPSRTARLPLVGTASRTVLATLPAQPRLIRRYGTEAVNVQALARRDPSLGEPVAPGLPVTRAEFLWAVRHEGALDVSDLLDRRTRVGLVAADRAAAEPAARATLAAFPLIMGG